MKRFWVPSLEVQSWMRATYTYDPTSGAVFRDGRQLKPQFDGRYHQIRICNKELGLGVLVTVHRVAWFLHHGEFPTTPIDHINLDKLDNRIENLRLCSYSQNSAYRPKQTRKTTSRFKGVSWQSSFNKWRAYIVVDGKKRGLGSFEIEEDAAKAYNQAAINAFGEFAILNEVSS